MPAAGDLPAAEARIEIEEPAQIEPPVQAVEAGVDVAQDEELAVDERQQIESLAEQVDDLVSSVERVVQQAQVTAQAMSAPEPSDVQSDLQVSSQQTLSEMPQDSGTASLPDYVLWLNEKLVQSQQWLGYEAT